MDPSDSLMAALRVFKRRFFKERQGESYRKATVYVARTLLQFSPPRLLSEGVAYTTARSRTHGTAVFRIECGMLNVEFVFSQS